MFKLTIPKGAPSGILAAPSVQVSPDTVKTAERACELGFEMNDRCEPEIAVLFLQRALQLDPRHGRSAIELGNTLSDMGRPERALEVFDTFLADEDDKAVRFGRGSFMLRQGRLDEAIEDYLKCIAMDPKWLDPYPKLILAFCRGDRGAEAKPFLDDYAALGPDARSLDMLTTMVKKRTSG